MDKQKVEKSRNRWIALVNYMAVCLAVVALFWISLRRIGVHFELSFVWDFKIRIWVGFIMTIKISFLAMILSLFIGVACAALQNTRILFLRYLCSLYVQFIRGTPLIMQIYLFFYIIGTAWGVDNRMVAGVIILSVFEGAYITEIIRGSLISIGKDQLEAARAVGFSNMQTVRYVLAPQMVERTLPALTGQFASVIKDSSLLSMIAVIELTQTMREISATNFKLFECYILLGFLYLILTLPISFISSRLERRFGYEN